MGEILQQFLNEVREAQLEDLESNKDMTFEELEARQEELDKVVTNQGAMLKILIDIIPGEEICSNEVVEQQRETWIKAIKMQEEMIKDQNEYMLLIIKNHLENLNQKEGR